MPDAESMQVIIMGPGVRGQLRPARSPSAGTTQARAVAHSRPAVSPYNEAVISDTRRPAG